MNTEQIIPKPETRIYVASLSDYNAGTLHGEWIDLQGKDVDDVHAEIQAMLRSSPSMKYPFAEVPEEWAIHDYEGFGPINLGEYETTETVVVIAELINEHGGAFAVWYAMKRDEYGVLTSEELAELFEESFCGEYESGSDYAQELAEAIGCFSVEHGSSSLGNPVDVSGRWPFTCIDWDRAWRELSHDGYWTERSGAPSYGVYVFR